MEHWAGGHHRVIAITVGLDSSQESSIDGLNLKENNWSNTVTSIGSLVIGA